MATVQALSGEPGGLIPGAASAHPVAVLTALDGEPAHDGGLGHRPPGLLPASPPLARLGEGSGAATHGGSLNRSTLWVSEKTCEESNQDTDSLEDMRCLLMRKM